MRPEHDSGRAAHAVGVAEAAAVTLERALAELARFDGSLPIEAASTPPASWYTDPAFLELERARLFRRSWQPVARLDQLNEVGAYVAGSFLGEPYVVVRAAENELRALSNVCAHRAAVIASGEGRATEWVCPYHGWTYALDGRLRRARGAGGMQGFEREGFGLRRLSLWTWGPLVFVSWAADPPPFGVSSEPAAAQVFGVGAGALRFVEQRRYCVRSNWKVVVDNYLDGGYHVPVLHGELAASLDMDSYTTEVQELGVLQRVGTRREDADPRVSGGALYGWWHPTWMINRYGPLLDVNRVVPIDAGSTRIVYDFYATPERSGDAEFLRASLAESERIQREDTEICERVQAGLESSSYERGRYAPRFEAGAHRFHQLLARDLRCGSGAPPASSAEPETGQTTKAS